MRIKIIFIVLLLLLAVASGSAMTKFETVPLQPGQGIFAPCASGIVTAYVDDGMAVVECHPIPQAEKARK